MSPSQERDRAGAEARARARPGQVAGVGVDSELDEAVALLVGDEQVKWEAQAWGMTQHVLADMSEKGRELHNAFSRV